MSGLPTFLIIGAAKSGTTSLYQYLGQHPEVYMSPEKEPHFFAFKDHPLNFKGPGDGKIIERTTPSLPEYQKLFEEAEPSMAVGEASPSTLYIPVAASRVAHHLPEARLIAILRNPIDRARSNFYTMLIQGREPCSDFETALQKEKARIAANWSMFWHYKQIGFYHAQLSRFYDLFDHSQIHVCLFEEFIDDTVRVVQDIFRFLNVDPTFVPDTSTRHNPSGQPRSWILHWLLQLAGIGTKVRETLPSALTKEIGERARPIIRQIRRWKKGLIQKNLERPSLSDETRTQLQDVYREDVLHLQDLIDRDLSHWLD